MSRDPKDAGSNDKFSGIRAGDVNYGSVENHGATTGHVIGDGNTIIGTIRTYVGRYKTIATTLEEYAAKIKRVDVKMKSLADRIRSTSSILTDIRDLVLESSERNVKLSLENRAVNELYVDVKRCEITFESTRKMFETIKKASDTSHLRDGTSEKIQLARVHLKELKEHFEVIELEIQDRKLNLHIRLSVFQIHIQHADRAPQGMWDMIVELVKDMKRNENRLNMARTSLSGDKGPRSSKYNPGLGNTADRSIKPDSTTRSGESSDAFARSDFRSRSGKDADFTKTSEFTQPLDGFENDSHYPSSRFGANRLPHLGPDLNSRTERIQDLYHRYSPPYVPPAQPIPDFPRRMISDYQARYAGWRMQKGSDGKIPVPKKAVQSWKHPISTPLILSNEELFLEVRAIEDGNTKRGFSLQQVFDRLTSDDKRRAITELITSQNQSLQAWEADLEWKMAGLRIRTKVVSRRKTETEHITVILKTELMIPPPSEPIPWPRPSRPSSTAPGMAIPPWQNPQVPATGPIPMTGGRPQGQRVSVPLQPPPYTSHVRPTKMQNQGMNVAQQSRPMQQHGQHMGQGPQPMQRPPPPPHMQSQMHGGRMVGLTGMGNVHGAQDHMMAGNAQYPPGGNMMNHGMNMGQHSRPVHQQNPQHMGQGQQFDQRPPAPQGQGQMYGGANGQLPPPPPPGMGGHPGHGPRGGARPPPPPPSGMGGLPQHGQHHANMSYIPGTFPQGSAMHSRRNSQPNIQVLHNHRPKHKTHHGSPSDENWDTESGRSHDGGPSRRQDTKSIRRGRKNVSFELSDEWDSGTGRSDSVRSEAKSGQSRSSARGRPSIIIHERFDRPAMPTTMHVPPRAGSISERMSQVQAREERTHRSTQGDFVLLTPQRRRDSDSRREAQAPALVRNETPARPEDTLLDELLKDWKEVQ